MSRFVPFCMRSQLTRFRRRLTARRPRLGTLVLMLIATAGFISFGIAKDDAPQEKPSTTKESSPPPAGESSVEKALAEKIDLDFVETPLKDVAASIAKKTGVNVLLDNKAITDAGASADTPITFMIKRIPLRSALRHLLQEHELNFIIESDNVLLVTSDTAAKEHTVTRIYDAHDFARPARKFTENEPNLDALIDLITANIAQSSWSSAGGNGQINQFGNQLVITQLPDILDEIDSLFTGLREARDFPQKFIDAGGSVGLGREGPKAAIVRRLQRRHDISYVETPLKDVGKSLSIATGVPIGFDFKALTDAGTAVDLPITFEGTNLRFDVALRLMLREHELNYIIDQEILLITSDTKAKEHVVTDYYPVGDVVGDTSGKTAKEVDDAYESLIDTIKTTIAPTSWTDSGGNGSVTAFSPCKAIVCTQTDEIHAELAALLTKLRAGRTMDTTSQAGQPTSAFATHIYQLAPDHADAAEDYVNVIRNLIEPKTWTGHGGFLGKVPGAIIARCSSATHERIELLLEELQALPRPPLGPTKGGGGPLVGGLGGGSGGAF